jgi:hypothetical protein
MAISELIVHEEFGASAGADEITGDQFRGAGDHPNHDHHTG